SVRFRAAEQETRHLGQALAATVPAAFMASGTFDSFSFSTFTGTMFIVVGTIGALHRIAAISKHSPVQAAMPGDRMITSTFMIDNRRRHRAAVAGGPLLTPAASGDSERSSAS